MADDAALSPVAPATIASVGERSRSPSIESETEK